MAMNRFGKKESNDRNTNVRRKANRRMEQLDFTSLERRNLMATIAWENRAEFDQRSERLGSCSCRSSRKHARHLQTRGNRQRQLLFRDLSG